MKNPLDYNKAVYTCMALVQASYLTFSLIVYKWCGKWVANPSLGSAGETVKKVTFGIGLIGLIVSACLYLVCMPPGSRSASFSANKWMKHVGAKYVFVRILRDSKHLQQVCWNLKKVLMRLHSNLGKNTMVHWVTWLSCTTILGSLAFILAEAIPIFNFLIALVGSLCFAPLAIVRPSYSPLI